MSEATERTQDEQGQTETTETQIDQNDQKEVETLSMTKEEYDKALQTEADRRVAQAVKKREEQHKKELELKTEEARREAEELAKLSAEERNKVEKEREELRITKERESLASERREFEHEKLKLQAEKELVTRNLPAEFAPYIYGDNAEDTMERISTFEEQWQKALQGAIEDRLRVKSPKVGGGKNNQYTKQQLEHMTADEINANWETISQQMAAGKL